MTCYNILNKGCIKMKKVICLTIVLVLIMGVFTACNKNQKQEPVTNGENSQITGTNNTVSEQENLNNSKESVSSKPNKTNSANKNEENKTAQSNSNKENTTVTDKGSASDNSVADNIDNGVLKSANAEQMVVPENMQLLSKNSAREENIGQSIRTTVGIYELDGAVVNWITEDDYIYAITQGNNRLVVINSKKMMAVANIPLAGKPAEINIYGNKIYISLPDLCKIDVFSKSSYSKLSSLYFEHEVSSFCIDGNYVYYAEHDQHCEVFRKNLATNELQKISGVMNGFFYQPKLYLNKKDNILYVGECGNSGSALYYYDATTLQLKSFFKKDNYGIMNHTRDIFHIGDEIFWGNYRLSDTNAKELIGRYGVAQYGSVNFASKDVVSTYEGLFLTDTYECIIDYFDDDFDYEYILVTDSYNVFFRDRDYLKRNIIIGVNFGVQ